MPKKDAQPRKAESLTVLEVLQSSTEFLAKRGIESPRLNAEHLIAHALGKKQRIELYLEFDRPLGSAELAPMRALIQRRGKGEPLQHIQGTVDFYGRMFLSDRRALIPRPETEQLVELLLALELPSAEPRFLDVGVGSGVIALTLAAERPSARVEAVDQSEDALSLARENAGKLDLSERIVFFHGDLLAPASGPYDLIAANLPYVPSGDMAGLSKEVKHDPASALDGGADGLDLVARCILQAYDKLAPGGWLGLEIGHDQAPKVGELLTSAGYGEVRAAKDYQGVERFMLATRPKG
jgi:release factor glutamine methyltransferase